MGLFDFFRKKTTVQNPPAPAPAADPTGLLLQELKAALLRAGCRVKTHPQYLALIVNGELEVAPVVLEDPRQHPLLLQAMILAIHPQYFPGGMEDMVVGLGQTVAGKVAAAAETYVSNTFMPVLQSLSNGHDEALDLVAAPGDEESVWHPNLGNIVVQGAWPAEIAATLLYDIVRKEVPGRLTADTMNWLKMYISKRADGTIIGDCHFNNEPWPEGLALLTRYAASWQMTGEFAALKQFIVFRKCGSHGE